MDGDIRDFEEQQSTREFIHEIVLEYIYNYKLLFNRNAEYAMAYTFSQYENGFAKRKDYYVAIFTLLIFIILFDFNISDEYFTHLESKLIIGVTENKLDLQHFEIEIYEYFHHEGRNIVLAIMDNNIKE
ncbi:MAG: hypothetical protein P0Y55_09940 [Candidatus Cohnella colombiensis]|uniref:Uncharacterized protein n=1 Tax=Candidatus Cohnella colombiensis TaxID=3121368 RepID=A0AA95EX70_9BACL|nr:MAG: hypothetical protein P0Y55_09940 [Cohnella sp.]